MTQIYHPNICMATSTFLSSKWQINEISLSCHYHHYLCWWDRIYAHLELCKINMASFSDNIWGKRPVILFLAKWLSVRLQTKWLWIRIPLLSLQILHLFRARSSLTFRQLQSVDICNMITTYRQSGYKGTLIWYLSWSRYFGRQI